MTSDRGNSGGGAAGAAHLQLTQPVQPKSGRLNPNASEFLSKTPSGGQDVNQWGETTEAPLSHPVHAINNSVYDLSNGSVNKFDNDVVVGSFPADVVVSAPSPVFTNHVVQIVQPSTAPITLEFSVPEPVEMTSPPPPPPALIENNNANASGTTSPYHADDVLPCLDGTIPEDRLRALLRTQLDYYFSRENLAHDTYLISQMDSDHYVPIRIVAHFNQVKKLTTNMQLIVQVLRELPTVQVDESGEKVRPNHNRCIVILREIPESTPLEEVKNLFAGKNCPPYVSCEFAHNDSWYVTFDSDEDAQRAYQYLREEVCTFLDRPIMARIKAKPLVRSTFVPRNGMKQTFEPIPSYIPTQPTLPLAAPVHVSQHQPPAPSPVYPNSQAVPAMQYINTNQQPFQFNPYHVMTWPTTAMLNPSMAFYYNDFQAESVKLNANPAPRQFQSVPRNRNPPKPVNRPANPQPLEIPNIVAPPLAPNPPPPRVSIPEPTRNVVNANITSERSYPSMTPPQSIPTTSHHTPDPPAPPPPPSTYSGAGNLWRREHVAAANMGSQQHARNIPNNSTQMHANNQPHPTPVTHSNNNNNTPHSNHAPHTTNTLHAGTHNTTGHHAPNIPQQHTMVPHRHTDNASHRHDIPRHDTSANHRHDSSGYNRHDQALSHRHEPMQNRHESSKEPLMNSSSGLQSRGVPQKYISRRRRPEEEGAKNMKPSSNSSRDQQRAQQFDLGSQLNSFPPLAGFNTSTTTGDLHTENKLSDVVKGTTKIPTSQPNSTKDHSATKHSLPQTPPTPPKEMNHVAPLTPNTPSNNNNNNNTTKNIIGSPPENPVFLENSLPTPPNSPPHKSPVSSSSPTTTTSPPATKPDSSNTQQSREDKSETSSNVTIASNSSSDEKQPVKLSYAQMVQRQKAAATAAAEQSTVVNGDRSDSDSGGGRKPTDKQNNNDQCQNTRSGSSSRSNRDSESREQREQRIRRNIRNDRDRRNIRNNYERARVK